MSEDNLEKAAEALVDVYGWEYIDTIKEVFKLGAEWRQQVIDKDISELAKKEFPDTQFSDADIWNRKCFITGFKAALKYKSEELTLLKKELYEIQPGKKADPG